MTTITRRNQSVGRVVGPGRGVLPSQQTYGPDLIVNGGFDADTDWTKGGGWTIAAGVADRAFQSAASNLTQQVVGLKANTTYRVRYTVVAIDVQGGRVQARYTDDGATVNPVNGKTRNAPGIYAENLTTGPTSAWLMMRALTNSGVTIDNVSLREVL